ncbi:hypothetical protein NKH12_15300, partial [Mesorhizobium sp. M1322]
PGVPRPPAGGRSPPPPPAAGSGSCGGVYRGPAPAPTLFVLEVNSMPAWAGLQSVVAVNIADAIADALLKFLADRTEAAAARPYRLTAPANS